MENSDLENKNVLITGGVDGIGYECAKKFQELGSNVTVTCLTRKSYEKFLDLGKTIKVERLDITNEISIEELKEKINKLDILINNAALFDAAETIDITRESFDQLYGVNVAGTLFTLQAAAKQMIAQGHGGKIINMASQAGRRGESLVLVYCSSKAAVISMTQSAGLNLIRHGINVNAIAPGVVDGDHWVHVDAMFAKLEGKATGQKRAEVEAGVPAGRFATPNDLVGMAVFLASREADYIVGQTYNVDGGQWLS